MKFKIGVNSTTNEKILAVNVDGSPIYSFEPNVIPQGKGDLILEVSGVLLDKGRHILELVTEKGNYYKYEFFL
ncbi:hypothetical protein HS7_11500 [Sulfolobales archaeon HS-7]|nr:hypothetical protein HS7_11500 [Sulfolobales archaeon HS-7]